jgi:tetrahydromethanopterin S-methyltransferase subunit A
VPLNHRLKNFFRQRILGRRRAENWPFISGPYYVLDDTAPVIVITPDNQSLADNLAALSVHGLCMVTAICRSASDIEILTRNVEANLAIHCIILAGGEGRSYPALEALSAIFGDSDEISDKAARLAHNVRGKLKSFDFDALEKRVKVVDMLDCSEVDKVIAGVNKYGTEGIRPDTGFIVQSYDTTLGVQRVIAPTSISHAYSADKAGRFIVTTQQKSIVVEHYNSKGELLRLIEGATARDLCILLIRNGWVSRLDHAAYLGRELTLAETAIKEDLPYSQQMQEPADDDPLNPGAAK